MLKSSGSVALATLLSRILGLLRVMVYAHFMGTGLIASAFTYAYTIPNLFRRLLGEGALTAAFIPHFKEKEKLEGDQAMWRSANAVICALFIVTTAVVLILIVVTSLLIHSGWLQVKTALMLDLLRVMAPYLILVCFAAVCMGMLNSRGHFFVPSLGSCLLNIIMIASVFFIAPHLGATLEKQVFGLAIGVVLAGFAQALYQMPWLRRDGFRLQWVNPWTHPSVKHVGRQMIPGIMGVAAFQLNIMVSQGVGYWVADHVVATFECAVRLMELPQGLFGVSMAVYLLPTLSGLATDKNYDLFRSTLQDGWSYVLVTNMLAMSLLIVLGEPIVRLLFERGSFDALSTERVSRALLFLAPSLVAYSSVNILARAFYALGDTQTPTRISIGCLVLNLFLTLVFIWPLQESGMGFANSATSFFNAGMLMFALRKKMGRFDFQPIKEALWKLTIAGLLSAGLAGWVSRTWHSHFGHITLNSRIGHVVVPTLAATILYLVACWLLKVHHAKHLLERAASGLRRLLK